MLTKDQAEIIASDLLQQEHARRSEAKNARAARVPWFYRSAPLRALEPWQQAELVLRATKAVGSQWAATTAVFAWIVLVALAWAAAGTFAMNWSLAAVLPAMLLPLTLIRAWFVRRELASLLAV